MPIPFPSRSARSDQHMLEGRQRRSRENQFYMYSIPLRVTVTWRGEPSSVIGPSAGGVDPEGGALRHRRLRGPGCTPAAVLVRHSDLQIILPHYPHRALSIELVSAREPEVMGKARAYPPGLEGSAAARTVTGGS